MSNTGVKNKIKLIVSNAFYKKINVLCNFFFTTISLIQSPLPHFEVIVDIAIIIHLSRCGWLPIVESLIFGTNYYLDDWTTKEHFRYSLVNLCLFYAESYNRELIRTKCQNFANGYMNFIKKWKKRASRQILALEHRHYQKTLEETKLPIQLIYKIRGYLLQPCVIKNLLGVEKSFAVAGIFCVFLIYILFLHLLNIGFIMSGLLLTKL